jgi:hypothetical protein
MGARGAIVVPSISTLSAKAMAPVMAVLLAYASKQSLLEPVTD